MSFLELVKEKLLSRGMTLPPTSPAELPKPAPPWPKVNGFGTWPRCYVLTSGADGILGVVPEDLGRNYLLLQVVANVGGAIIFAACGRLATANDGIVLGATPIIFRRSQDDMVCRAYWHILADPPGAGNIVAVITG